MSDMAESPGLKDESIDPKTFVQNIRELGKKRDEEDAERHRLLEEQILQGRTERAARRAERQRTLSISPDKRHSFGSVRSIDSPRSPHERPAASPTTMEPTSQPGSPGDALKRLTGSPAEMPETENTSPTRQSASSLSRSGTLSWQQRRPASSSGRRPLSMFAQDSVTTRPLSSGRNDAPKAESDAVPRSQIAQSLGSKDPSWFRQTADRGEGSRAYRKDRDTEDTVSEAGSASTRKQLPGMSRDWTADMSESTPPGSAHSSSIRDSTAASARFSTNTSMSGFSNRDSKSPMPALDSQRFPAPGSSRPTSSHADEHTSPDRGLAMSSAQGRLAHDRSPSPTKGMGGFVQSAMMKRTESVNKRWSQQTPGRLSRQNSTASNASGLGGPLDIFNTPRLESTPRSPSREPSTESRSRPGSSHRPASSHSNLTITRGGAEEPKEPKILDGDGFAMPSTPRSLHSRGKSLSALRARSSYSEDQTENGSPVSPSKRFSPTKSTWLESAINRPEAPSVKPRAPPPQPSWMAEIQKNKAQRASVDLSQRVGSMDLDNKASSPAWVSKADTIRGSITRGSTLASSADLKLDPPIPVASSSEAITDADAEKPPAPSSVDNTASSPSPKPATLPTPPAGMESVATTTTTESVVSPTIVPETQGPKTATEKTPSALKSTASPSLRSPTSPRGPLDASAKTDSPPKRDFRANLKSRQPPSDGGKKEELEFQNVFGKLRKAQQDKFVAPDVLKGNIVRGKDGLNKTDGPKPRERKDELRQSLIAQKEAIKAKTEEGGSPQRRKSSVSAASPTVPEALAKRRALGRNGSVSQASSPSSPVKDPPTPEAIARQKHLRERSKSSVSSPVQESPKDEVPEVPKPLSRQPSVPDKPVEEPVNPLARRPTAPAEKPAEEPVKPLSRRPTAPAEKPADTPAEKPAEKPADKPAEKPADKPAEESPKPLTRKPTAPAEKSAEESPKPLARKPTAPVEKASEPPAKSLARRPTAPAEKSAEEPAKPSWKRQPSSNGNSTEKPTEPLKPLTKRPTLPADKPVEEPAKPSWKRQQSIPDKPSEAPTKPLPSRPTPPSDKAAQEAVVPPWKKQLSSKSKEEPAKSVGEKAALPDEQSKDDPPKSWNRPQALPGMAKEDAPKPLSRQPSKPETPQDEASKPLSRETSNSDKTTDEPVPGKATSRMSAKLAERFNPALAGVLARGPSPMAGNSTANRQSGGFPSAPSTTAGADEPTAKAKDLTHMTKGRARGPKRRAPAAKKEAETGKKEAEAVANPPPVTAAPLVKPKDVLPSTEPTAENVVTPKPIRMSGNFSGSKGPKPPTPAKSPDLAKRLSSMSLSSPLASPKLENDEDATFATAGSESSPQLNKRLSLRKSIPPERPSSPKPPEIVKRLSLMSLSSPLASPKVEQDEDSAFATAGSESSPQLNKRSSIRKSIPPEKPSSPKPFIAELEKRFGPPAAAEKPASPKPTSPLASSEPSPKPLSQSRFNQDPRPLPNPPTSNPAPAEVPKATKSLPSPSAIQEAKNENVEPKPLFQSRFNHATSSPSNSSGPKPTPPELPKPTPLSSPPAEETKEEKTEPKPAFQSRFNQATRAPLSSSGPKPASAEPPKPTPLSSPPAEEAKEEKTEPKPAFQSRFNQATRAPLSSSGPKPASAEPSKPTPLSSPPAEEAKEEKTVPKPAFQSRFNQASRAPLSSSGPKPASAEPPKPSSPLPSPPAEEAKEEKTEPKPAFQSRFNQASRAPLSSSGPKPASAEPPKPTPLSSPPAEEAKEEKTEPKPAFQSRFNQDTPPSLSSSPKPLPREPPQMTRPLPTPPAPESSKPEKVEAKPEASAPSVKNAASHWGRPTSPTMTRAKSPIKLPTRKDEAAANEEAGLNRPEPPPKGPIGLGLAGVAEAPKPTPIIRKPMERKPIEQPKLATKFPLSPPNSGGLPLKPERRPSRSSDPISPIPQSTEAGKLFADFFDEAPVTTGKLDVDTNAILNNNVLDQGEMKTTSHRIQEVTGDGKTLPMPEQEDYILYDESMYICTHGYETSNGSKTEVYYFWSGSAVPEPLVEDTLRSVRKTASDAKCKLITMKQGKELPGFFQALGGQLVIRKGSRTQHSNEYMLCVRHHLGNYAFDEVELSLSSLCSGFAYLVTSRTSLLAGKVYLWRGAGCNGDELGMARLVGASLGLTPGFTEIEQGREPADFLSVFPAPAHGPRRVPASSPHWNLKARADKNYAVRLFRVDEHKQAANGGFQVSSLWPSIMRRVSSQSLPSPTSSVPQTPVCDIAEIAPFDQTDLEAEHVYVLDAFFEMYIIVGALSRSQSHAFSTALLFAQEYGILSASAQDRPFVPDTKVVLEGVPTDMKFVFRRWTDAAMPTAALMAGRPRTANGLRVVPLSAAIAATRE